MKELLWVEKYRPNTIKECILPTNLKNQFESYLKAQNSPNLILTGSPGIGKTSIAKAILKEYGCDYIVINGSNEGRLIDTLRNRITQFASTISIDGKRKYVIIDEAEYMPKDTVQAGFRHDIEKFHKTCGFIFTCNDSSIIIDALKSRCTEIDFVLNKKEINECSKLMIKRLIHILDNENVKYDPKAIVELLKRFRPDWRKCIMELQGSVRNGSIDNDILLSEKSMNVDEVITLIKNKKLSDLRSYIAENGIIFNVFVDELYEKIDGNVSKISEAEIIVIMAEYIDKYTRSINKDITLMAMLLEISRVAEWETK